MIGFESCLTPKKLQNKTKIKEFIREISKIQTEIRDGISLKVKNFNTLIDKHKKVYNVSERNRF